MSEAIQPTPQEAQDQAYAAIHFAEVTDTVAGGVNYNRRGVIMHGTVKTSDWSPEEYELYYHDNAGYRVERPSDNRDTKATAIVKPTQDSSQSIYRANIFTNGADATKLEASVSRRGYGHHEFSDANKLKAATLITSLTAKGVTRPATKQAEKIIDAQAKFNERTSK